MLPAAEAVVRRLTHAHGAHTASRVLDQLANSTGWLVDTTYASLVRPGLSFGNPSSHLLHAELTAPMQNCRRAFWGTVPADLREEQSPAGAPDGLVRPLLPARLGGPGRSGL